VFTTLPTWDEQYNNISNKGKYKERYQKYIGQENSNNQMLIQEEKTTTQDLTAWRNSGGS